MLTFLYDLFVLLVVAYILILLYSHRHEILNNYESFTNMQPKHLEELPCSVSENNDNNIKKYTLYKNSIPTNMFGDNSYYL